MGSCVSQALWVEKGLVPPKSGALLPRSTQCLVTLLVSGSGGGGVFLAGRVLLRWLWGWAGKSTLFYSIVPLVCRGLTIFWHPSLYGENLPSTWNRGRSGMQRGPHKSTHAVVVSRGSVRCTIPKPPIPASPVQGNGKQAQVV